MRYRKASFVNARALSHTIVESWVSAGLVKFSVVSPFFGYFKIHESVLGAMGLLRFLRDAIPNSFDSSFMDEFYSALVELYSVIGEDGYMIDSTGVDQSVPTVAYDKDGNVWYGFGVRLIPMTDRLPSEPVLDAGKEHPLNTIDKVFPSAVDSVPKIQQDNSEEVPYLGNWEFTQPVMTQTNFPFDTPEPGMEGVLFPDVLFVVEEVNKDKDEITIRYVSDDEKETIPLSDFRKTWVKWLKLP